MATKKVNVTIKGISPLLMHRFPMVVKKGLEKLPKDEQAELSAYRTEDGELFIPGENILKAILDAAKYGPPKAKGKPTLKTIVAACLFVKESQVLLGTRNYEIDTRSVVMKATGGRILRHRPCIKDWQLTFTLIWDSELLSEKELRQLVDDFGRLVGLGDFRPAKFGPFGRSMVTKWETE
jgi:hypothetical protein